MQDIQSLLNHSENELTLIEEQYNKALSVRDIPVSLKIKIKNYLENLISVLDYLAIFVFKNTVGLHAGNIPRIYFPILEKKIDFEIKMEQYFPSLGVKHPIIYKAFENVQPFITNDKLLLTFKKITNNLKHVELVPQERIERDEIRVINERGTVSWNPANVKFGAGVWIMGNPVNPVTQEIINVDNAKVERIKWIDFKFKDTDVSAFVLMRDGFKKIESTVIEFQKLFMS